MVRWAYVNGRYVPHARARVHIEDRGFQFADSVYEVVAVLDGQLVDFQGHMARLDRSLGEIRMAWPKSRRVIALIIGELLERNRVDRGTVYLQVTRGVAPRDFKFPAKSTGTLVITTKRLKVLVQPALLESGARVITIPDLRWARRDIKSVGLLPQVLGKQQAADAGAFEAWQVDAEGRITEGCSSNAWIVTAEGVLVTRQATADILNGVTRLSLLRLAAEAGIGHEIRPFTLGEAYAAREAFASSASIMVVPVVAIDGRPVGDGRPGALAAQLRQAYLQNAERTRL